MLGLDTEDLSLWTSSGIPRLSEVENQLSFKLTAGDRNRAWAEVKKRQAQSDG